MKKLAMGASAALLMSYSFAAHATTTISVGVAANFAGALAAVIANFEADYPNYSVTYTSASTGTLTTNIINGGTSGPYDLFLAADTSAPTYLATNYSSLVESGSQFDYAEGYLTLWSSTKNEINVSFGLPSSFVSLVIGDPSSGVYGYNVPYGHAAAQVLSNYGISLPDSRVSTASSIGATYAAVDNGTYPMGFVAKSQTGTCNPSSGAYTPNADTYTYYNYAPGSSTYDAIIQDGIIIARTRTSDQETEVQTFVDYLLNNTSSKNTVRSFCYGILN